MDINQAILNHSQHPITMQLLKTWLKEYKRPNDKISALTSEGLLTRVKRGIYIAGPQLNTGRPESPLIANHLLGPSYVSIDSALSFYGLIPERVYSVTSMTTKASRDFATPIGMFSYINLPLPYYAFGISMIKLTSEQYAMIASPEKALCDKIVNTSGLTLRSISSTGDYLLENLRMDEAILKTLNFQMIREWLPDSPKKESLNFVVRWLQS